MQQSFSFLSEDLRRQQELAQSALEEAERIDRLLKEGAISDLRAKESLEHARSALLKVARGLASNVSSTSTFASSGTTAPPSEGFGGLLGRLLK